MGWLSGECQIMKNYILLLWPQFWLYRPLTWFPGCSRCLNKVAIPICALISLGESYSTSSPTAPSLLLDLLPLCLQIILAPSKLSNADYIPYIINTLHFQLPSYPVWYQTQCLSSLTIFAFWDHFWPLFSTSSYLPSTIYHTSSTYYTPSLLAILFDTLPCLYPYSRLLALTSTFLEPFLALLTQVFFLSWLMMPTAGDMVALHILLSGQDSLVA